MHCSDITYESKLNIIVLFAFYCNILIYTAISVKCYSDKLLRLPYNSVFKQYVLYLPTEYTHNILRAVYLTELCEYNIQCMKMINCYENYPS